MKFLSLFAALAALALLPHSARAEDAPAAPPGLPAASAPQTPAPAPSAPAAAQQPAPAAKKEEDETSAWSISNLAAYLKSKGSLANAAAEKDKTITALQARVAELENGTALKALQAENQKLQSENQRLLTDLQGVAAYAQSHGLLKEDAPQTPAGQAAGQAIAGAVSRNLSALGVPLAQLPAAAGGSAAVTDDAISAVIEQMEASTDPRERGRLASKLSTMRAAQAKASSN